MVHQVGNGVIGEVYSLVQHKCEKAPKSGQDAFIHIKFLLWLTTIVLECNTFVSTHLVV
jgi:hypothetical protein